MLCCALCMSNSHEEDCGPTHNNAPCDLLDRETFHLQFYGVLLQSILCSKLLFWVCTFGKLQHCV